MNVSRLLIGTGIGLILLVPLILPDNAEKKFGVTPSLQDQKWDEPAARAEIEKHGFWRRAISERQIEELIETVITMRKMDVVFVDDRGTIERTCETIDSSDHGADLRCCRVGYRTMVVPGRIGERYIFIGIFNNYGKRPSRQQVYAMLKRKLAAAQGEF